MNKVFKILIIAIISLLPEVMQAQEVKPIFSVFGDYMRGGGIGAGISYADYDNEAFSMDCQLSWSYPMTSFGLTYIIRPINGKAGQIFGFGFDALYFYKAHLSANSFASNGANGSSLFTDPYSKWRSTKIAIIPSLEISAPIRNFRVGFIGQPFAFASWNYDSKDKSWSQWKQYYSFRFFVSFHLSSYIDMDTYKINTLNPFRVYDTGFG